MDDMRNLVCPICQTQVLAPKAGNIIVNCGVCNQNFRTPPAAPTQPVLDQGLNEHALFNQLCPYCQTDLSYRDQPEICFQCNRKISWVSGNSSVHSHEWYEEKRHEGLPVGACKPGQEIRALELLNREITRQNTNYSIKRRRESSSGCLIFLFVIFALTATSVTIA